MDVPDAPQISSDAAHTRRPMARTPARHALATRSWRAWADRSPSASSNSAAASTPWTSGTDGVNGKRPCPCHVSRQSSSDRNDPRGAAVLASMTSHASGLIAMSDMATGPPRHFWGPATSRSSCHASAWSSTPPRDETQSTSVTTPRSRQMGPMRSMGLRVPEGVSEWTTEHTRISGCPSRYAATAAGSMA